jgi:hypothetical protein
VLTDSFAISPEGAAGSALSIVGVARLSANVRLIVESKINFNVISLVMLRFNVSEMSLGVVVRDVVVLPGVSIAKVRDIF